MVFFICSWWQGPSYRIHRLQRRKYIGMRNVTTGPVTYSFWHFCCAHMEYGCWTNGRLLLNYVVFLDTVRCLRLELYNIWEAGYAVILGGMGRTHAAGLTSVQGLRLALSIVQSFTHDWPHTTVRILECWITCLTFWHWSFTFN